MQYNRHHLNSGLWRRSEAAWVLALARPVCHIEDPTDRCEASDIMHPIREWELRSMWQVHVEHDALGDDHPALNKFLSEIQNSSARE